MTAPGRPRTTWAQRAQGFSNDLDLTLRALARRVHPKVQWWWGRRQWWDGVDPDDPITDTVEVTGVYPAYRRTGAWCYVCDCPIAIWSGRWPMTLTARERVNDHRLLHLQGILDMPATPQEEAS